MSNKNLKRKALSNEQLKNVAGGWGPKTKKTFVFNGKRIEYDINNPFEGLSYDESQALAKYLKKNYPNTYKRFVN